MAVSATLHEQSYDLAISCAGEDKEYAAILVENLQTAGLTVFYYLDPRIQAQFVGGDLQVMLLNVFAKQAKHCLILISRNYLTSEYTTLERQGAFDRARKEQGYLIPVRLDDSIVPGLPESIAYFDARSKSESEITLLILSKLGAYRAQAEIIEQTKSPTPWVLHPLAEVWPAIALFTMLNIVTGGTVFTYTLGLLFLDTVGTCCVALTFGPWYAAACGTLTNLTAAAIFGFKYRYQDFAVVNAALGFYWGFLSCRWPQLSSVGPVAQFRDRFRFLMWYGVGGGVLATLIVDPIELSILKLQSVAPFIQNDVTLYNAMLQILHRHAPDHLSYSLSYLLYSVPDKIACTMLALLVMSYLMPLYRKNTALFASMHCATNERAGPCAALVVGLLDVVLVVISGHKWIAIFWAPLLLVTLICLVHGAGALSSSRQKLLADTAARWHDIQMRVINYRKQMFVYRVIGRVVIIAAAIMGYYLIWFVVALRLHLYGFDFKSQDILTQSIINVLLVLLLVIAGALVSVVVINDNLAYLQLNLKSSDIVSENASK